MGCLFVHVDYRRNDVLFANLLAKELRGPLEVGPNILHLPALEELGAGGDEGVYEAGAVFAGAAPRHRDPAVYFLPVAASGLDDVEVVLASAGVDVGIAGVFFFGALMVGLQPTGGTTLVLCEP